MTRVGDTFQQATKYGRTIIGEGPDWSLQPDQYKTYPHHKIIPLPQPKASTPCTLDEVLKKRKSIRYFSTKPITKSQLSYLLWASTGIQRREGNVDYRTAPSAGALYPIETYLVINNVKDLPRGVYHYHIPDHILEELKNGDFGAAIAQAALHQDMCYDAAVVFIWTAIFNRSKCKYGQRAYRYIYLDTGHIAQNLALSAVSLDLGSCQIGALFDDEVNQIIDVDGKEESTIYLSAVGGIPPV
jgi:SagB-type dehydrogenase family enzyme